jgi:hypothetical protein
MPHAAGRTDSSAQNRCPSVDREFRLAVEDYEHLFIGVMEVMSDTSAGHDLTAVNEVQIDIHGRRRH